MDHGAESYLRFLAGDDKDDLPCSLTEVTYEQNLFVHERIEPGFHPNEYLEEIFKEYIQS